MPQITATAIAGVFKISQRLRCACVPAARGVGVGMLIIKNKSEPMTLIAITAKYVPINGTTIDSAVTFTNCGPMIAEAKPPAITYEIAFGLNSSDAVSAAANRKNPWADI